MTRLSVGQTLDDLVAYSYVGARPVEAADFIEKLEEIRPYIQRRPRLATYAFPSLMRTPVHDLPHDGVGVVAIHQREWDLLLEVYGTEELPSAMDVGVLWGIAVEQW